MRLRSLIYAENCAVNVPKNAESMMPSTVRIALKHAAHVKKHVGLQNNGLHPGKSGFPGCFSKDM
jgi:hypothetical protein